MAKYCNPAVLDAALNHIKNNATRMIACSAQPANFAGVAAVSLGDVAMTGTDFTLAAGDTNGRKVTVGAKASVSIDATGTANHVVLVDDTNSALLYATTATALALTAGAGNTVSIPAWDIEFADPV